MGLGYLYACLVWVLGVWRLFGTDFKCIEFYFEAELARVSGVRAGVLPLLWSGVLRGVPGLRVHLHLEQVKIAFYTRRANMASPGLKGLNLYI